MNAAKAKAAAKQKGKSKAAAAAAAAAAEKAEKAVAAPPPPKATAAVPARTRPSVTQYWGDSASSTPAAGGGIIRIGYDQAKFEQAFKDVVMEPKDLNNPEPAVVEGEDGEKEKEDGAEEKAVAVPPTQPEAKEEVVKVEVKKEDIALIASEMDVTNKEADAILRRNGGNLRKALEELVAPAQIVVANSNLKRPIIL